MRTDKDQILRDMVTIRGVALRTDEPIDPDRTALESPTTSLSGTELLAPTGRIAKLAHILRLRKAGLIALDLTRQAIERKAQGVYLFRSGRSVEPSYDYQRGDFTLACDSKSLRGLQWTTTIFGDIPFGTKIELEMTSDGKAKLDVIFNDRLTYHSGLKSMRKLTPREARIATFVTNGFLAGGNP